MRASVTGDRLVGQHQLTVAFATDVFASDELRTPAATSTGAGAAAGRTAVRLGPVYSGDVQMQFAVPRLRQFLTYASYRWRAPFSRDGKQVAQSSGQYLDTGIRASVAAGPQRDIVLGADARVHSGLGVDEGLPTSGVASGGFSAGLELRRGLLSVQPYLRAQSGGFGGGVVAVTRF
jgi:hypothetical protein